MQKDLNKSLEIRQKVGNWSDISRGGNNRAVCKQHRNTPVSTWARWAPSRVTCSGSTVRTRAQHSVPGLALGPCAGQDGHSCLARDVWGLGKGNYCSCLLLTAAKEPVLRCSGRLCCKNSVQRQFITGLSPGQGSWAQQDQPWGLWVAQPGLGVCSSLCDSGPVPPVIYPHPMLQRHVFVLAKFLLLLNLYHLWKVGAEQELGLKFLIWIPFNQLLTFYTASLPCVTFFSLLFWNEQDVMLKTTSEAIKT